ncbi:MAG: PEGA domain-containing protein [Fibrobacter sp.]|jgi:hypothetical protein|nr:PEGA domain-containing protein [Fibrobacter sp.]
MIKNFILFVVSIAYITILTGCATIKRGTTQEIIINSNIEGAIIELDGKQIGTTPFKGEIKRDKEKLTVRKSGYDTSYIELKITRDEATSGNGILGVAAGSPYFLIGISIAISPNGIDGDINPTRQGALLSGATTFGVGLAVAGLVAVFASSTDNATGAAWEYSPSEYYVQLKPADQSSLDFSKELAIRYFATVNHSQIAIDAGKTPGEYAKALANLMESKTNTETANQYINEALKKSEGNQLIFADKLINSYYQ